MPASSPREFPADPAREPVPATTVREQLARVVNSPGFVSSARLTRFLAHIVNRTIDGDLDTLGGLRACFDNRWDEAERLYERALELRPGHATAQMFRAVSSLCRGNILPAESGLRRPAELDPISASGFAGMAYLHYVTGDYRSAAGPCR